MKSSAVSAAAVAHRNSSGHSRAVPTALKRAAIAFFVHRTDVDRFDAAREIDPVYAAELDRAAQTGVEILPLAVRLVTSEGASGLWSLGWELPGLLPWEARR